MKRKLLSILAFLAGFSFTAQAAALKVAVTHPFYAEWVEKVGGDSVEAVLITEDDSSGLDQATLVYETGLGQEPWLDAAVEQTGQSPRRIVLSDGIPTMTETETFWTSMPLPHPNPEKMPECCRKDAADTNAAWERLVETVPTVEKPEKYGYDPEAADPHLWYNPLNAQGAVLVISETLADVSPESADTFDRNAYHYLETLGDLDGWIKSRVREIPMENRVLVTDGGSFRYYAKAYGFAAPLDNPEYVGLVFKEARSSCLCTDCTCEDCGCTAEELVLETVPGAENTESYDALMRKNTKVIEQALTSVSDN